MTPRTQQRPDQTGRPRGAEADVVIDVTAVEAAANAAPATVPVVLPVHLPPLPRRSPEDVATVPEIAARTAVRDRKALRDRTSRTKTEPADRPGRRRPALRDRAPMRERTTLRDRASLRGRAAARSAAPAALRHHTVRPHRRRKLLVRVAGLLVLSVLACCLGGGYQVRSVESSLAAARGDTRAVQKQLAGYRWAGASAGLTRARLHAEAADRVTRGRFWRLARRVPYVGGDVAALERVAGTTNQLAQAARPLETTLPKLTALGGSPATDPTGMSAATGTGAATARDGRSDVEALRAVSATLPAIDRALTSGSEQLRGVPSSGLLGPIADGVSETRTILDSAHATVGSASPVLGLLPDMLGSQGRRTWLVLLEQPAAASKSAPSTTGLPPATGRVGAYAVVHTLDGEPTVTARHRRPAVSAGALAGTLARQAGGRPDYVLVLDAPALAALVQAAGTIRVGTRTLDGANAERFLRHDVFGYGRGTAWTDAVAGVVLGRSLAQLAAGQADWPELIRSLGGPIGSRQLQVWSADTQAQTRLLQLSVAAGTDAGEAGTLARRVTGPK